MHNYSECTDGILLLCLTCSNVTAKTKEISFDLYDFDKTDSGCNNSFCVLSLFTFMYFCLIC